jgi:hypothetical protein
MDMLRNLVDTMELLKKHTTLLTLSVYYCLPACTEVPKSSKSPYLGGKLFLILLFSIILL